MNFRFEPYCENCEFVEPMAIKNWSRDLKTGMRIGAKMTIECAHARLCKRLHHNIKAVEEAKNCSDEAVLEAGEVPEKVPEKVENCSDEAAES